MQQHYSTVAGDEVRAGVARVVSLVLFAKAQQGKSGDPDGDGGGSSEESSAEVEKKTA
jgi:hypothetical protein